MPFPRAYLYIAGFLAVTIVAFWPTYFSVLNVAPRAHHIHGVTATLWALLLIWQSWSIHQSSFNLHKWGGRISFLLAPPFIVGGLLVTKMTAIKVSPFTEMFAISLTFADFVSVAAFALFYFLALQNRKSVEHHSRYMMATIFPLIPPSVARLIAVYAPGIAIRGPEDLPNFGIALNLSFAVAALFTITLLVNDFRHKKPLLPFMLSFVSLLIMIVSYHTYGNTEQWRQIILAYAALSDTTLIIAGLALGAGISFFGWVLPNKFTSAKHDAN